MIGTDLYSNIEASLKDWLESTGGFVSNLPLSLLNRAQSDLWEEYDWQLLVKDLKLTVAEKIVTNFPASTFGKIMLVYGDHTGDGKPDFLYHEEGAVHRGYTLRGDGFTKAAGNAFVMTFFESPEVDSFLRYQVRLPDFEGGSEAEFSFFPGNLLLAKAQLIRVGEAGSEFNDYNIILDRYNKSIFDVVESYQYRNQDPEYLVNDDRGDEIHTESYDLATGQQSDVPRDRDPSFDNSD